MLDKEELRKKLRLIDGKGYKAYKELTGAYDYGVFFLYLDYIQGDPFASPSRIRIVVPQEKAGFPQSLFANQFRKIALEDFVARQLAIGIRSFNKRTSGIGKSGLIANDCPGQEILFRTAVVVSRENIEARLVIGLPAQRRIILGLEAEKIFFEYLTLIVKNALFYDNLVKEEVSRHVELVEDQEYLRQCLRDQGLIAFVASGSTLPRKSGASNEPMPENSAIRFVAPPSLEREFSLPNRGKIRGMVVYQGITLIVGGGYHGKSTLLKAFERGCYNHIEGDGREFVITISETMKIRAEDGRAVMGVNISPFINNLPYHQDTNSFFTQDASGSTSQAANIMEALEGGAKLLLLDEDTSATNFMIRDVRMQELVTKEKEPITPFIDKIQQLYQEHGVSTILVLGGSGDYLDVAHQVIMMEGYLPQDVTIQAQEIKRKFPLERRQEGGSSFGEVKERLILSLGLNYPKEDKIKIDAKGVHNLLLGKQPLDLNGLEQLVDVSQTRAIGNYLYYCSKKYLDGKKTINEVIELAWQDIAKDGLDIISPFYGKHPGDYALPRKLEILAAISRLRNAQLK